MIGEHTEPYLRAQLGHQPRYRTLGCDAAAPLLGLGLATLLALGMLALQAFLQFPDLLLDLPATFLDVEEDIVGIEVLLVPARWSSPKWNDSFCSNSCKGDSLNLVSTPQWIRRVLLLKWRIIRRRVAVWRP